MLRNAFTLLVGLSSMNAVAQAENYPVGSTVANFITIGTDGTFHTLYDYTSAGKVVILDFFFYACVPCQEYAPYFSELYQTYGCNSGGLVCLSINAGIDTDEVAEQFSEDFGGDFAHPPTIGVNGGTVTSIFGVNTFPSVCVIGTDNTMLDNDLWPTSFESFVAALPTDANIVPMSCTVAASALPTAALTQVMASITSDLLTVTSDLHGGQDLEVELTDHLGRTVLRSAMGMVPSGNTTQTMDVSMLSAGAYVVRVVANGSTIGARPVVLTR